MNNNDFSGLISTVIKKRKEVYYLVTENDLNTLRSSSIIGDISIIIASIVLSGYFLDKNSYALFAGIVFVLIAIGFYFFVFSRVKSLKSSGEVQSINVGSEIKETYKQEYSKDNMIGDKIEKNKLIILGAAYFTSERTKYVEKELQKMVKDNKLIMVASNDVFGDPHPGEPKKLLVKYEYNGVQIIKTFNEGDKIELP